MTSDFRRWSYNDLDHVVWSDGSQDKKTGVCFAMSVLVGARYYFTEHLAANAELGMIGGCQQRVYRRLGTPFLYHCAVSMPDSLAH